MLSTPFVPCEHFPYSDVSSQFQGALSIPDVLKASSDTAIGTQSSVAPDNFSTIPGWPTPEIDLSSILSQSWDDPETRPTPEVTFTPSTVPSSPSPLAPAYHIPESVQVMPPELPSPFTSCDQSENTVRAKYYSSANSRNSKAVHVFACF
ncbi:hypothetical protein PG994_002998 [Apiospora phragmitis]|uniref:Uncharacterized protein n=1 Tax=Apiospora phragmitis TaxID=2905665 RepID=A0ABR1W9K7_9PEZI